MLRRPLEPGQYLSIRYTERLADAGIEPSVGSVGDSYDNAMAETVIGLYKTEVIRRRGPWRNLECVEFATLGWVDWFNNRRLLEPIRVRSSSRIRGSLLLEQKDACPDGGSQLTKSPKNPGRLTADAGIEDGRAGPVSREHVVGAPFVGGLAVGHRADDRQFVCDRGSAG